MLAAIWEGHVECVKVLVSKVRTLSIPYMELRVLYMEPWVKLWAAHHVWSYGPVIYMKQRR